MNKQGILMDKSKLMIVKFSRMFVILPFTVTRVEVRTRNIVINMRPKFEGISNFVQSYLKVFEFQDALEKEEAKEWEAEQKRLAKLKAKEAKNKKGTIISEGPKTNVVIDQSSISQNNSQMGLLKSNEREDNALNSKSAGGDSRAEMSFPEPGQSR